jgi:hypothetical protein
MICPSHPDLMEHPNIWRIRQIIRIC